MYSKKFEKSIKIAKNIFKDESMGFDDYILIKLHKRTCCHCLKCLRPFWDEIEKHFNISKEKENIIDLDRNEGNFILEKESLKVVLECHESGPEIVAMIISSQDIITIVSILTTVISIFQNTYPSKKQGTKTKITIKMGSDEVNLETEQDVNIDKIIEKFINKKRK